MKIVACCFLLLVLVSGGIAIAEPPEKVADKDLVSAAEQFVQQLAKGDFSAAGKEFDVTMRHALPTAKLKQTWESLLANVGALKKQLNTRTQRLGEYEAVLVTCQFEKANCDVKVVFNRSKKISGLFFLPTYQRPRYAKPATFKERKVQVGTGEWALPGTLTMPLGDGPFPAVVLVHGSGPNDRDETIGPNKPFCDLAWGLASNGIAVLHYEKRTKWHAKKTVALNDSFTVKEGTIDDALAAVLLLSNTEKVAPSKIFLLGHSLGGMLVPRIAARDDKIAGFIVLAGTGRPLEDILHGQLEYIFSLDGNISESEETTLRKWKSKVARVKDPGLSPNTPSAELPFGTPAKYWLDLRGYHAPQMARDMKRPILILQGGRDYQVTMEDFQCWKNALSLHKNVRFELYPRLNHLFVEGDQKSTPTEYQIPGHVAEAVVADIATWIKQQSLRARRQPRTDAKK